MEIYFLEQIKQSIKQFSLEEAPNETCGIILKNENKIEAIKCKNHASNKEQKFLISPFDFLKIGNSGEIIGYFHSHLNSTKFSLIDRIQSEAHHLPSIIYSIQEDLFNTYIPNNFKNPYIGLEFKIGVSDCFSLFRNFYKNELNIEIVDCYRNEFSFEGNEDLFEKIYELEKDNFVRFYDFNQLKRNDGIIFKMIKDKASHIAIYLGGGQILHHPRNNLSLIENLTDSYKRRIGYFVKHRSFC